MKALTFLLFLAAAGLGAWGVYEHIERTRLETELGLMTKERNALAKTARGKTGLIAGMEIKEDGPRGLKDLGIPLDEDGENEAPASRAKNPGDKEPSVPGDMMKMMRDPAMQEMIRAQAGAQLEMEYRDLFDLLTLDDKKRENVMGVLKSRLSSQLELGMKAMDKGATPEARAKASDELAAAMEESTAKLKGELGGDYGKFERFEKSKPEREQLKVLGSMLKDKGLDLDEATESRLMDTMYTERQAFKFDHDLSDMSRAAPEKVSPESVDRYLEQNAVLQQQIQGKAKDILSQDQYDVFLKSQENQQQMMQMGLKMWQKMNLDGGTTEARN